MKKNILFISHDRKYSGANRSLLSLIVHIKDNYNVTVLVNSKDGELINKLESNDIEYIYFPYAWWYSKKRNSIFKGIYRFTIDCIKYYFHKLFYFRILKILKDRKIDFVYTNTSTIDIGYYISKKLKCKHVWHIREFGIEDFDFRSIVFTKYRNNVINSADKVIVISNALKEKYLNIINESSKLEMVYNGFEVSNFIANPKKHDFKKINIIQVGQVNKSKGQDQLIRAANNLRNNGYNINLFFAGSYDISYLTPFLNEINDYQDWIHILGQVEDVYSLRDNMDIEVICSRCEAFGRVTIEAMLHSLPVVGSNTGGTPELIDDGVNGLLFEYGNIDSLEEKLEKLINDHELYYHIMNNEVEFAKNFTMNNTTEKVLNILKEMCD